jgi:hypothetical protein
MAQATCEECRYNQRARCHDRTVYGLEGGGPTHYGVLSLMKEELMRRTHLLKFLVTILPLSGHVNCQGAVLCLLCSSVLTIADDSAREP